MTHYVVNLRIEVEAESAAHAAEVATDMRMLLLDYESAHKTIGITGSVSAAPKIDNRK